MSRLVVFLDKVEQALNKRNDVNLPLLYFRRGVYAILLLKMLFIWPDLHMFYQHVTVAQHLPVSYNPSRIIFLPQLASFLNLFWFCGCAIIALSILMKCNFWRSFLVALISLNYLSLMYLSENGGDIILNYFVCIMVFVDERAKMGEVKNLLNRAVFYLILTTICCVYFINGYSKIVQYAWRDGSFMNAVWQLKYYANTNFVPAWFSFQYVTLITAWLVMLFELFFPVLVWYKQLHKYLVFLGVIFHIFIAVFLSLPDFGLVMIMPYILLINWDKARCFLK